MQPRAPQPAVTKGYGPACPECGSVRSKCLERGWSEPDDHYLRRKRCNECGVQFVSAEVVVPMERTTFYRLDYRGRQNRRRWYRDVKAKTTRRLPQNTRASDQLHISVKVTKQHAQWERCMRGHPFSEENTYVNPASGFRQCRICRQANERRYRAERARSRAA